MPYGMWRLYRFILPCGQQNKMISTLMNTYTFANYHFINVFLVFATKTRHCLISYRLGLPPHLFFNMWEMLCCIHV